MFSYKNKFNFQLWIKLSFFISFLRTMDYPQKPGSTSNYYFFSESKWYWGYSDSDYFRWKTSILQFFNIKWYRCNINYQPSSWKYFFVCTIKKGSFHLRSQIILISVYNSVVSELQNSVGNPNQHGSHDRVLSQSQILWFFQSCDGLEELNWSKRIHIVIGIKWFDSRDKLCWVIRQWSQRKKIRKRISFFGLYCAFFKCFPSEHKIDRLFQCEQLQIISYHAFDKHKWDRWEIGETHNKSNVLSNSDFLHFSDGVHSDRHSLHFVFCFE